VLYLPSAAGNRQLMIWLLGDAAACIARSACGEGLCPPLFSDPRIVLDGFSR
jgi:hypothetical protein